MSQKPNPLTRGKKQQALALLQQHRLDEARTLLAQVCNSDCRDAEAWYLLGAVNHGLRRLNEAAACCRQVIDLQPGNTDAHYSLGVLLQELGELENAILHYQQALTIKPDFLEACSNLGAIFEALGKLDEATQSYAQALNIDPKQAELHYNLGNALHRLGRFEEAAERFRQAITLRAGYAEAHHNLGNALLALGRLDEAENCFHQVIAFRPNYAEAFYNLGIALRGQNRLDEAVASYQRALVLKPDYVDALNNLGLALTDMGRLDEAVASYQRALVLKPDYVDALNNLGLALTDMGRLDEAAAICQQALAIKPDHVSTLHNLGFIRISQARLGEGIASYRRALALKPDDAKTHVNLSLALLRMGDFECGWEEYEWRWREHKMRPRSLAQPLWDGTDLHGRTLLLHAEQGLGDTLQFIRYAHLVAQRGGRVIVECQPPLKRLLARMNEDIPVYARGEPLPTFDVHCPLLSLPWLLGTTLETIPADIPYLAADPDEVSAWRARLGPDDRLKVGLVWSGDPRKYDPECRRADQRRSFPLTIYAPLAHIAGVQLYSLQKGEAAQQARHPPDGMVLVDHTEALHDFADTAALIANLDLVISVDTSVAHLAGALGKPVWLLSRYNGCWRWLTDRSDTPWYPTMRVFRQQTPDGWDDTMSEVVTALRKLPAP